MTEIDTVADGLDFPEGPVALADGHVEHRPMPDPMTTNICFGGRDLRTAFITLSWTGRLVAVDWPVPGLRLNQYG